MLYICYSFVDSNYIVLAFYCYPGLKWKQVFCNTYFMSGEIKEFKKKNVLIFKKKLHSSVYLFDGSQGPYKKVNPMIKQSTCVVFRLGSK